MKAFINAKKIIAVFAVGAVLLTVPACGAGGKVIMATNAGFEPFEYITSADSGLLGEFTGVDVAIGLEIAKELGKDLQIDNMEFEAVLTAIPQGKADFAAAGMTIKPDRLENMDFSIPYFTAQQVIIVKEENETIKTAADLYDVNVGVVDGYTGADICRIDLALPNVSGYKQGTGAIMDLTAGRIEAVVLDKHTAEAFVSLNEGLKTVSDAEAFEKEEYAIAVKKGNSELLVKINKVLQRLLDDGSINKWFDEHMDSLSKNR